MKDSFVSIRGLEKRFSGTVALGGVDLAIRKGEIFGLVGPDGAGKSTLLRCMAGILEPGAGSIHIAGIRVRAGDPSIKSRLAYMPGRFGLYEDLTVEENLDFFARLYGVGKVQREKRKPQLYDFSNLGKFKKRYAGHLSGGMKQKLGLACCLIHRPELVLLDEPTNGVDPVSRREFWRILYGLLKQGVSFVVSTAYMDEAERCSRVGLMHKGKLLRLGTPQEIKKTMRGTLLEIKSADTWKSEMILRGEKSFAGLIRQGSRLRVFTGDPQATGRRIHELLGEKDVVIHPKAPTLQDCFIGILAGGDE